MRRAVVLIAIAALFACAITLVDSPGAAEGASVSDYHYGDPADPQGTVSGKVSIDTQEPIYLTGVKVNLYDLSTGMDIIETTVFTDGNGYKITYNTGTYGIRFEMNGYDTVTDQVTILENTDVPMSVTMKTSSSYFGFDLPHAFMILGGAAAIVLILFAVIRRARM